MKSTTTSDTRCDSLTQHSTNPKVIYLTLYKFNFTKKSIKNEAQAHDDAVLIGCICVTNSMTNIDMPHLRALSQIYASSVQV